MKVAAIIPVLLISAAAQDFNKTIQENSERLRNTECVTQVPYFNDFGQFHIGSMSRLAVGTKQWYFQGLENQEGKSAVVTYHMGKGDFFLSEVWDLEQKNYYIETHWLSIVPYESTKYGFPLLYLVNARPDLFVRKSEYRKPIETSDYVIFPGAFAPIGNCILYFDKRMKTFTRAFTKFGGSDVEVKGIEFTSFKGVVVCSQEFWKITSQDGVVSLRTFNEFKQCKPEPEDDANLWVDNHMVLSDMQGYKNNDAAIEEDIAKLEKMPDCPIRANLITHISSLHSKKDFFSGHKRVAECSFAVRTILGESAAVSDFEKTIVAACNVLKEVPTIDKEADSKLAAAFEGIGKRYVVPAVYFLYQAAPGFHGEKAGNFEGWEPKGFAGKVLLTYHLLDSGKVSIAKDMFQSLLQDNEFCSGYFEPVLSPCFREFLATGEPAFRGWILKNSNDFGALCRAIQSVVEEGGDASEACKRLAQLYDSGVPVERDTERALTELVTSLMDFAKKGGESLERAKACYAVLARPIFARPVEYVLGEINQMKLSQREFLSLAEKARNAAIIFNYSYTVSNTYSYIQSMRKTLHEKCKNGTITGFEKAVLAKIYRNMRDWIASDHEPDEDEVKDVERDASSFTYFTTEFPETAHTCLSAPVEGAYVETQLGAIADRMPALIERIVLEPAAHSWWFYVSETQDRDSADGFVGVARALLKSQSEKGSIGKSLAAVIRNLNKYHAFLETIFPGLYSTLYRNQSHSEYAMALTRYVVLSKDILDSQAYSEHSGQQLVEDIVELNDSDPKLARVVCTVALEEGVDLAGMDEDEELKDILHDVQSNDQFVDWYVQNMKQKVESGDEKKIAEIIDAVQSDDPEVREQALQKMRKLGAPEISMLVPHLKSEKAAVRDAVRSVIYPVARGAYVRHWVEKAFGND